MTINFSPTVIEAYDDDFEGNSRHLAFKFVIFDDHCVEFKSEILLSKGNIDDFLQKIKAAFDTLELK